MPFHNLQFKRYACSMGLISLAAAALLQASGCVSSPGRAQYTAHVRQGIIAGPANARGDISIAFGLDGNAIRNTAVAAASSDEGE